MALRKTAALLCLLALGTGACTAPSHSFRANPASVQASLDTLTIRTAQAMMAKGELTSEALVSAYIERIAKHDAVYRAVVGINPKALEQARLLDEERASGRVRGPLHGIPVLLKDNIDSVEQPNTGGSVLLADNIPAKDAPLVEHLRAAGAVILGKANLSEWANFRSSKSTSGWSGVGGQTRNAYDPALTPCGSSSGSAVAVALAFTMVAIGTETDGSIVCPSSHNSVVGVKPTLGLVSRTGIIPIASSFDMAGPIARTVEDAALVLEVIQGEDSADPESIEPLGPLSTDLRPDALRGMRIGVAESLLGYEADLDRAFRQQLERMKELGATIVPVEIASLDSVWEKEGMVLEYEFKAGIEAYLKGTSVKYRTLADLIEGNQEHADKELWKFDQSIFQSAVERGPLTSPEYVAALAHIRKVTRIDAIDKTMAEGRLDFIAAPTANSAWRIEEGRSDGESNPVWGGVASHAALSGYPHITIPMGYGADGRAYGMSFIAGARAEKVLLQAAYAFEKATAVRKAPVLRTP